MPSLSPPNWDPTLLEAFLDEAVEILEKTPGATRFTSSENEIRTNAIRDTLKNQPCLCIGKLRFGIFGMLRSGVPGNESLRVVAPVGLMPLIEAKYQAATKSATPATAASDRAATEVNDTRARSTRAMDPRPHRDVETMPLIGSKRRASGNSCTRNDTPKRTKQDNFKWHLTPSPWK